MATRSSFLAWETPMDRKAWQATYSPWGHRRVGHDLATKTATDAALHYKFVNDYLLLHSQDYEMTPKMYVCIYWPLLKKWNSFVCVP